MELPGTARRAIVICPMLPAPVRSGGHKRTLRLLEAIDRAGAVPHLVTDDAGEPDGVAELRDRGWGVDLVPRAPLSTLSRVRQHLDRLPSPYLMPVAGRLRELVAEGCAFVQAEHTQSAYYGAALAPAPWALSLHNVDSRLLHGIARATRPITPAGVGAWNRWHAMRTTERRRYAEADAVLCVSESDRAHVAGTTGRALLVPNGVDDNLFAIGPRLPDDEIVVFFGRLDYAPNEHGVERFLRDGWPVLAAGRPAARLRLVGAGLSPRLARLVDAAPGVEAVGFVPDLPAELARARLVVAPLWQGGGTRLKVLESLAANRPVAGTPLGVAGIGFQDGVHGLVGESPAELARACVDLLDDDVRAGAVAAAGRQLADGRRWRRVLAPAEELYASWLAGGPGRRPAERRGSR